MINTENRHALLNTVSQEALYLLPVTAGGKLLQIAEEDDSATNWATWFRSAMNWSPQEINASLARPGDVEDKLVYLDLFLWKQRHGLIDVALRPRSNLGLRARSITYPIHRYMVAREYEGLLDGNDPYTGVGVNYRQEAELLLRRWKTADFGTQADDFGDLVLLLSVAARGLRGSPWRDQIHTFVSYIVANVDTDGRLAGFKDRSHNLSSLILVLSDLDSEPSTAIETIRRLLASHQQVSLRYYPALITGLDTYGAAFREVLERIKIQGGLEVFNFLTSP